MGYWYPQGYPQMQGQFLQHAQYYNQYYSQQAQYMNSMRMPTPAAGTWQPGQPAAAPPTPAAPLQPGQQPAMVTYTMPQYPTQWNRSPTEPCQLKPVTYGTFFGRALLEPCSAIYRFFRAAPLTLLSSTRVAPQPSSHSILKTIVRKRIRNSVYLFLFFISLFLNLKDWVEYSLHRRLVSYSRF